MKQTILFLFSLVCIANASFALDIPAGTYYFDNSKTNYSNVQFLCGTDSPESYTIVNMVNKGNNIWQLDIPVSILNTDRYSFTHTTLPAGTFTDMGFSAKKDQIYGNRTATTSAIMIIGGTFTPDNGDNWVQGRWLVKAEPSGTLPIFYLNTENGKEIESKEEYLQATMYIDALNIPNYESFGTAEIPIATETKGRGNYTWWGFDKKPYRIKMIKKASLLNMTTDKSFNLLTHADDPTFLRNEVGFELSRRLGLAFTPKQEPIELVKNGEYLGLYFLTEHIKVSKERVNVIEQGENETDPNVITGGWLVEIDNYEEEGQVSTDRVERFTIKSPDAMSAEQRNYIQKHLQKVENAIYVSNKNSVEWEKYIDLETLVDYYIIQEIMGNTESFHGSCYFSKDRDTETEAKIYFGPVWDFGNAYRHKDLFIYEGGQFSVNWLPEIVKFPRFQDQVKKRWAEIKNTELATIYDYIDEFSGKIRQAVTYDYNKWPQYGSYTYENDVKSVKDYLQERIAWLEKQWYTATSVDTPSYNAIRVYPNPSNGIMYVDAAQEQLINIQLFDLLGKKLNSFTYSGNVLNLNVNEGTYILQLQTESGTESKIIIVNNNN